MSSHATTSAMAPQDIVVLVFCMIGIWFATRHLVIAYLSDERPPRRDPVRTVVRRDGTIERWCENQKCHECPHLTQPLPRARARNERGRWPHRSRR